MKLLNINRRSVIAQFIARLLRVRRLKSATTVISRCAKLIHTRCVQGWTTDVVAKFLPHEVLRLSLWTKWGISRKRLLALALILLLILNSYILNLKSTFSAAGDITNQNEYYKVTEEETGVRYKIDTGGTEPLFYKASDGVWRDRDTALEDSTEPSFFKQAIKNQFHVFFQEKFNQGNLIRYKYDQDFEAKGKAQVDITPQKLQWIEDGGNKHSIVEPPNNVTGTFTGSQATYTGAYGTGLDMEYEVTKSKLKKTLIVQTNTSLPSPPRIFLMAQTPP